MGSSLVPNGFVLGHPQFLVMPMNARENVDNVENNIKKERNKW